MVEIENKYKIYEKKFGYVNWIGFWTLYKKEVLRFLIVVIQTVISPLVTSLLFLLVLSLAIGNDRGDVLLHGVEVAQTTDFLLSVPTEKVSNQSLDAIMMGLSLYRLGSCTSRAMYCLAAVHN